jgi:hypothetical protein
MTEKKTEAKVSTEKSPVDMTPSEYAKRFNHLHRILTEGEKPNA